MGLVFRKNQWLFPVPGAKVGWDRWHSPSPNWQEKCHLFTTYSPCLLGGPICYRSHLLREPETTIDLVFFFSGEYMVHLFFMWIRGSCFFGWLLWVWGGSCPIFLVGVFFQVHHPKRSLKWSRWWQLNYYLFSPRKVGQIPILTSIFFKWVGEKPPTSMWWLLFAGFVMNVGFFGRLYIISSLGAWKWWVFIHSFFFGVVMLKDEPGKPYCWWFKNPHSQPPFGWCVFIIVVK